MPRKKNKHNAAVAVIYARYSSHNQRDVSIEEQVAKAMMLATDMGLSVIETYADRAVSGRSDRRPEFQRMMADAVEGSFRYVIAWKSNRMGRNMKEAMINTDLLLEMGVDCLYVEERFDSSAAGRFALRNMMNVNQYYSDSMSEDIKRGMMYNAENCMATGILPFGYKTDESLHIVLDPPRDDIVREIFGRVARGENRSDILCDLEARCVLNSRGKPISRNSLDRMLQNERYMGIYIYDTVRIEDGMPRIVSNELFYSVQERLKMKSSAKSRERSGPRFYLTGKLFCGHCKSHMVGTSGTGRHGETYYYYACSNKQHRKGCKKKNVRKEYIEDRIAQALAEKLLQDDVIEWIAEKTVEYNSSSEAVATLEALKAHRADTDRARANMMKAIEQGIITESTKSRLMELEREVMDIDRQIVIESGNVFTTPKEVIVESLQMFKDGDWHDEAYRAELFKLFLKAAYVYDDKIDIVFVFCDEGQPIAVPIEAYSEAAATIDKLENSNTKACSDKCPNGLPNEKYPNTCGIYFASGMFILRETL